jgi:hypothetical protein
MKATGERRFAAAPGLSWVVERDGVRLMDDLARRTEVLRYPEAAVWELLTGGHDVAAAARQLQWILAVPLAEAEACVQRSLEAWLAAGWLTPMAAEPGAGCDE